jgi:hypothetical protein
MEKAKFFLFSFLILSSINLHAQFLSAYGLTLGGTRSTQIWNDKIIDHTDKMKFRSGINGSLFLEFFRNSSIRWISEIQYNQKGAKLPNEDGSIDKSRTSYLCFNNFLKYLMEGYAYSPYILIGPRLEYLVADNGPVPFGLLHVTGSMGLGTEFNFKDPWIWFSEFHFNPGISKSYKSDPLEIKNRAYELRVGFKYNLGSMKNFDLCP